jgi:hypothetical protein
MPHADGCGIGCIAWGFGWQPAATGGPGMTAHDYAWMLECWREMMAKYKAGRPRAELGTDSAQPERQKPIPYPHSAPGKVTPCLGFDGGSLHIYQQGYGERDGDGYFIFKDDELDWEQDDGTDYRIVKLDNSDILFIRDHLNRLFPPSETGGEG